MKRSRFWLDSTSSDCTRSSSSVLKFPYSVWTEAEAVSQSTDIPYNSAFGLFLLVFFS